jgi:GNAT superfamily N-acetyltransferase
MPDELPSLETLVDAADAGLHPWVHDHVAEPVRRSALADELGFCLHTAAQDLTYAAAFAEVAPEIGQPVAAYLDRWVPIGDGAHVLVGPRYLGRNPNLPFVMVSAGDRPLTPVDRTHLQEVAREHLSAFDPGFVMLTTADPIGGWPDTRPELRQVVGPLGELRRRDAPAELAVTPRGDTDFYEHYQEMFDRDVARDPVHARHTRVEDRQDLQDLADRGLLFDVRIDGAWAGILAGEPDARRGIRGATVVELILDHPYRGRGYGKHLSTLLSRALPLPDDECLLGTIHADNVTSYRSALAAGRVDVGGEIVIPL